MIVKFKTLLGKVYEVNQIEPTDTLDKLRNRIINILVNTSTGKPQNGEADVKAYTVKLVCKGKVLPESDIISIQEAGLKENDFVVVIPARKPKVPVVDPTPIPNAQSILAATGGDSSSTEMTNAEPITDPNQLQAQLQDLLSTLAGFSPDGGASRDQVAVVAAAAAIAASSAAGNAPPAAPAGPPTPDPAAVQQLTDMGFPEEGAKKALILNRMNTELAMEWLLEHGEDPDLNTPLTEEQLNQIAQAEANFVPETGSVQKLQEMGFSVEDINAALRATNNNYEAACAWLLGDRDVVDTGDESSPVIGAILSNPAVLSGLRNPRVLQAFQAMIADPSASQQYANDPEIGPILREVHRIIRNAD